MKYCCLLWLLMGPHCYATLTKTTPAVDANQQLHISSDQAMFDEKTGKALYLGNVTSHQGSRKLFADRLEIIRGKDDKIQQMIAIGNPARIEAATGQKHQHRKGSASKIIYFLDSDTLELIGQAEFIQDKGSIHGEHMIYDFTKEILKNHQNSARVTTIIQANK